jgi:hypothetical protein
MTDQSKARLELIRRLQHAVLMFEAAEAWWMAKWMRGLLEKELKHELSAKN